jgi:hypothetical protein
MSPEDTLAWQAPSSSRRAARGGGGGGGHAAYTHALIVPSAGLGVEQRYHGNCAAPAPARRSEPSSHPRPPPPLLRAHTSAPLWPLLPGRRCARLNGDALLGCATISGGCQLRRCLLRQFHQHSAEPVLSDLDTVELAQAAAPSRAKPARPPACLAFAGSRGTLPPISNAAAALGLSGQRALAAWKACSTDA